MDADQIFGPASKDVCEMNSSLQVTVFDAGTMKSLTLPSVPEGRISFSIRSDHGGAPFLHFEGRNGAWYAVCTEPGEFFVADIPIGGTLMLEDRCICLLRYQGKTYKLYAEMINDTQRVFHHYWVPSSEEISVGRDACDISCSNPLISRQHALLRWNGRFWVIRDLNSQNGTFVNERKVLGPRNLNLGDQIYIMGLRILVGTEFLALNDCGDRIKINSMKIRPLEADSMVGKNVLQKPHEETALFNRLPRRRVPMEDKEIDLEMPPMSMIGNKMPMVLRMGSSMVMGGSALLAGNITMVLSSLLFPILTQRFTEKERQEYEHRREEKYLEYLKNKEEEILTEIQKEHKMLNWNYPAISQVLQFTEEKYRLWERRKTDDDFLFLRIGTGRIPMRAKINYPPRRLDFSEDLLEKKMYQLAEKERFIERAPIVVSLEEDRVCGILGPYEQSMLLVRSLLMQLTILHSYDEVKTVVLVEAEDLQKIEFVKYLPHIWNDQRNFRFLATSMSEAYHISEYLKNELEEDLEKPRELRQILKSRPYYVVFALSKKIFQSMEILKDVLQEEKNCGVSVLAMFDDLPKECSLIFNLAQSGEYSVIHLKQLDRSGDQFSLDGFQERAAANSMRELANTHLKVVAQTYSLPKMVTFLEMFGVGRVEHLNPLARWAENNPIKSLATPVGVGADGSVFTLDLHEKHQGPHGLVAGMTGSGKSEFIITYILSLAVNYHPDEVAFILIDYKGGGLTGAFEDKSRGIHLPHLVGTITNLDGAAIQRSLLSIQSEMTRRQRVFNEVRNVSDEGTMNIYVYQKLYRNKLVKEPMPHLFIISDEFAELKQQRPEFMDQLISMARIGRSLGIHLILATQKPAGVVNDQIRSNTKFRVCLKVQDKSDSMDMLKRPEAAELKETGRFYLQVGYNEYFAMGQSAWSGAPYEPEDRVVSKQDNSIHFLDSVGQSVLEAKPRTKKEHASGAQLVAVVRMLDEIAKRNGIVSKKLWNPELPDRIDLNELLEGNHGTSKNGNAAIHLGVVDDPENQKQFPLVFDFVHCQNLMIVGDVGSGKTLLLQSILYTLSIACSPDSLNYYILDYSSRMLKTFKQAPHCGAVLCEEDSDLLDGFFDLIHEIITERKILFSELEVDSFEAANSIRKIPLILVVIDNISGLSGSKLGETHSYRMQSYLREGVNYGVKYIITCSHLNDLNSRVKQELGDRICLHMKDKYEYGEALGCKVTYVPPEKPGRGLCRYEERTLEFQCAMFGGEMEEKERYVCLRDEISKLKERYRNQDGARRLTVNSETATYEEFAGQFSGGRIPLGYAKPSGKPVALPLKQLSMLGIYFGNPLGVVPITENILYAAKREKMDVWVMKRAKDSIFSADNNNGIQREFYDSVRFFQPDANELHNLWKEMFAEMKKRKNLLQEYCVENGLDLSQEDAFAYTFRFLRNHTTPILLFIESFSDFCSAMDFISIQVFDKIFSTAKQRNMYMIGCFEPGDAPEASRGSLYNIFSLNGDMLLFGGRFDQQTICEVPLASGASEKVLQYNMGIMRYCGDMYSLIMPCGEMTPEEVDEDDKSIF